MRHRLGLKASLQVDLEESDDGLARYGGYV